MKLQELPATFENLSQRVVLSYCKLLAELTLLPSPAAHLSPERWESACRDLHHFFQALYETLYQHPEHYGLPVSPDVWIDSAQHETQDQKQAVNRKLQRPRDLINTGLDFLQAAGQQGALHEDALVFDLAPVLATLPKPKTIRAFLQGLASAGLKLDETGGQAVLTNTLYPAMMPALQALAAACASVADARLGKFYFASCDFRALQPGFQRDATELYRIFNPTDLACIQQVHRMLLDLHYTPIVSIAGPFAWNVQYQGSKKIKSTPLFQVEYQERRKDPLMTHIKCASSSRIIPLLDHQPQSLQADFAQRVFPCRGEACGWCKNSKALGPTTYTYNDQQQTICWYTNPDFQDFDARAVELVEQYAQLHEALA